MLALMDPSRQDLASYAEYLVAIQREARALNERFGTDGWQPIDLRVGDNFHRAVAAYKQFDVLLVNPIFDGMNLVAKEAPFVNERDGAVVLSENAGAHEMIGDWTITVNPFDIEGMAEGLYRALTMPQEERRRRNDALTRLRSASTTSAAGRATSSTTSTGCAAFRQPTRRSSLQD